jgi:hypothetical protein
MLLLAEFCVDGSDSLSDLQSEIHDLTMSSAKVAVLENIRKGSLFNISNTINPFVASFYAFFRKADNHFRPKDHFSISSIFSSLSITTSISSSASTSSV